jgi:prophage maintenance system killer protein
MNSDYPDPSLHQIILANKQITKRSNEPFGLDHPDNLKSILLEMASFNTITDKKERVIKKVSCLITGIVFDQPFKNGNKRTALAVAVLFIRNSGLSFYFGNKGQRKEIFDILERTSLRFEDEKQTALNEIENLMRARISN